MTTAARCVEALLADLASDTTVRLVEGRRSVTGREVAAEVSRATRRLAAAGVDSGTTVLFAIRPSIDALVHLCALVLAGCRVVLADLKEPEYLVRARLARVAPDVVLTERILSVASRPPIRRLLKRGVPPLRSYAGRLVTTSSRRTRPPAAHRPDPGTPALVVFTSGTTAEPKAVVHTQATLGAMFETLTNMLGDAGNEVVYSNQFHSLLPSIGAGARCVIGRSTDTGSIVGHMAATSATTWFTTPPVLLSAVEARDLPTSLRRVVVGSAPVTPALATRVRRYRPDIELVAVYAMTEAVPVAVTTGPEIEAYTGPGVLVGRTAPGVEVEVDEEEVVVTGPRVGHYLDQSAGPVRTGDLGFLTLDGALVLQGRKKDMILAGARNIYPGLHEPELERIPGVAAAAIVGVGDTYGDEAVWLAVEVDSAGDRDNVRRLVADSATAKALPVAGVWVTTLPRSGPSRKIDRAALRDEIRTANGSSA